MRAPFFLVLLALVVPWTVTAGEFRFPIRSTQISVDPPRYRVVIGFFDRYLLDITRTGR